MNTDRNSSQIFEVIRNRAKLLYRRIVLPESLDERILEAAGILARERIVIPVLVGNRDEIHDRAGKSGIVLNNVEIADMTDKNRMERYSRLYYELQKHKGLTFSEASGFINDPIYYSTMMVKTDEVDGYLAGAVTTTSKTVQAGLRILKTKPGISSVSSFFLMVLEDMKWGHDGVLLIADAAIITDMDAKKMADIAIMTAISAEAIVGMTPKIAMLSFSTRGSAASKSVSMVQKATRIVKETYPGLLIDGELQADAALIPEIAAQKAPQSAIQGTANILVFPCIESANISYKLVQRLAGAQAVGPILQGLSKPANDLSRGCNVDDIVNAAAITALQV